MQHHKHKHQDFVKLISVWLAASDTRLNFTDQLEFLNALSQKLPGQKIYNNFGEIEISLDPVDFRLLGTGDIVIYKSRDAILVGVVFGVIERQVLFYYEDCIQIETLTKNNLLSIPYHQGYGLR